ncbi:MAG: hypothetical protein AB7O66_11895, partial [Limisphaerales bacterium]
VKALASTSPDALLSGDGLTYRHNWGNRNGQWKLHLNWGSVRRGSRVFVTISECGHMGAARYTVHNVVPTDGGVTVWLNIEWGAPIPLCVDYLVVNPPGGAEGGADPAHGSDHGFAADSSDDDGDPGWIPRSDGGPLPAGEIARNVNEEAVISLSGGSPNALLSGDGFTYRHNWGNRHGQWKLRLNWGAIRAGSRVFVSISECGHMGAARYTVHNVAPSDGGVTVWVNVEWGSPIPLCVDYLVVNPPGAAQGGMADGSGVTSVTPSNPGLGDRAQGDLAPVPASDAEPRPTAEASADVTEGAVASLLGGSPGGALAGDGITYRHHWGNRSGQWKLRLNWGSIQPDSRVFVSISECGHMGAARYTVHNVVPSAGGVTVWVNIEWGSPIPLCVDYLVVNPGALAPNPIRTVQVTVHRHDTVALSNAEADRILADMGTVLQTSDASNDVATRVRFVRNGDVRVLPATVPASIQTAAQFNTLMGAGTGVKVVQRILWCGGPGGSIIGCAPVGNASVNLAVVRFTADQEGILWVHEYGHNAGLGHRTDDGNAVMFPSIAPNRRVVNLAESGNYLNGPLALHAGRFMAAAPPGAHANDPDDGAKAPEDILQFVRQTWIHGIPFRLARSYSEKDAEILVRLLAAPMENEPYLANIVTTLGYIGTAKSVEPLIAFVRNESLTSEKAFEAKNAALIHLGDLVHRTRSPAGLEFLKSIASNAASARRLAASMADAEIRRSAKAQTSEELAAELSISATWGLALAGTPEAREAIATLGKSTKSLEAASQVVAEALEVFEKVRSLGQQGYYDSKEAQGHRVH